MSEIVEERWTAEEAAHPWTFPTDLAEKVLTMMSHNHSMKTDSIGLIISINTKDSVGAIGASSGTFANSCRLTFAEDFQPPAFFLKTSSYPVECQEMTSRTSRSTRIRWMRRRANNRKAKRKRFLFRTFRILNLFLKFANPQNSLVKKVLSLKWIMYLCFCWTNYI